MDYVHILFNSLQQIHRRGKRGRRRSKEKYFGETPNRGEHRRQENLGIKNAEWGEVWGGVFPQPTRGLREHFELPAGAGAEPPPGTHFGVFWRPQNAPFLRLHADVLSSSNSVSCHIWGQGPQGWGLGRAIVPCSNVEPPLWLTQNQNANQALANT